MKSKTFRDKIEDKQILSHFRFHDERETPGPEARRTESAENKTITLQRAEKYIIEIYKDLPRAKVSCRDDVIKSSPGAL